MENGTRRRWERPTEDFNRERRYSNNGYEDPRSLEDFQERSRGKRQDVSEDRVSRSAPPTAVPLLGGTRTHQVTVILLAEQYCNNPVIVMIEKHC